ncbi:MAG TPA: SPOR domain-containing protein [Campylobacterales bacterium]|nr:SPOR domain-containing protein [Campylobacterales bacterium]
MKFFFIIFFLLMQSIEAIEISKESISTDSYYIQVGAFKNMSNIQRVKDRLFEYELYLEPYKGFQRIHIVNVLAPQEKEILVEIRKIYPKAFISKRPMKKPSTNFNRSHKLNNIKLFEQTLDSNTILKTRKSFL